MSDFSINVIPSSAQRIAAQMKGVEGYLEKFTRDMLMAEAALTARDFIKFTPPIPKGGGYGNTPAAKKQGEDAVMRDIRSFLMAEDKTMASAIQAAVSPYESFLKWKAGPAPRRNRIADLIHADPDIARAWRQAQNIAGRASKYKTGGYPLQSVAEIKQVHDDLRRRYKGRITNKGGPGHAITAKPFTAPVRLIEEYIKQRQAAVGTLSSYWWNIILKVPPIRIKGVDRNSGRSQVPAWVKRHSGNNGILLDGIGSGASAVSSVTIINPIGDLFGLAREANTKQNVINFRKVANQLKPWQRILDQAILTANRGGKPS